ncbi:MAG: hypothetical protein IPM76_26160 [Chloroflexi bacterium]|nr:hypothetical protein [Chloroflexota bacterium]
MDQFLTVPIHIDALHIIHPKTAVEAMADFSRLPWTDGQQDHFSRHPWLGESIQSPPLSDTNWTLQPGIHLHWALPDALTVARHVADNGRDRLEFPSVPNRWLVLRSRGNRVEKKWMVESDYLFPAEWRPQEDDPHDPIAFPVARPTPTSQPFRYLGRNTAFGGDWSEPVAERLPKLTAVGWGEPAFAAFYPNCRSVFGLHDPDTTALAGGDIAYDIIGWYSDVTTDPLHGLMAELRQKADSEADLGRVFQQAIGDQFRWTLPTDEALVVEQMVCYGRIRLADVAQPAPESAQNIDIAISNSGSEALSAWLAHRLAGEKHPKQQIEEQIEAITLAADLAHVKLDLGAKFQEARHSRTFTSEPGGNLWRVKSQSGAQPGHDADEAITLPLALAHALNRLNKLQQTYDRAADEIHDLRRQLYFDWSRYMMAAYPSDDEARDHQSPETLLDFIQQYPLAQLEQKLAANGELQMQPTGQGQARLTAHGGDESLARQLAQAIQDVNDQIGALNAALPPQGRRYKLQQGSAPRYWQPNEPVVLLAGAQIEPTDRHGQDGRLRPDGLLECGIAAGSDLRRAGDEAVTAVRRQLDALEAADTERIGFRGQNRREWHPLLLEWQAELSPISDYGNMAPFSRRYLPDFIENNYALGELEQTFAAQSTLTTTSTSTSIFRGRTIMQPHAPRLFKERLTRYLAALQKGGVAIDQLPPETQAAIANATSAAALLETDGLHVVSQALGGFNDALLMRHLTLQLDVADPLGFPDYQTISEGVLRPAIGSANDMAPLPFNQFHPIRCGDLNLVQLRLVDTWGQALHIDCENIIRTEEMTTPDESKVALPPRFAQPARLNARWLAALGDEAEMNSHPATSPICGWLVPNLLDLSLMVYDSGGDALGYLDQTGRWRLAPARQEPVLPHDIENPHLRQMVVWLSQMAQSTATRLATAHGRAHTPTDEERTRFMRDYLDVLESALENINPVDSQQHQVQALLMGRPMALVRASISLELKGLPAWQQSWLALRQEIEGHERNSAGFTAVRIPIRIGEHMQFNDGAVGWWVEQKNGYADDLFYAPQSHAFTHADDKRDNVVIFGEEGQERPLNISLAVDDPPQMLSILLDPRGALHITSGVLPVKALTIPPDQYLAALRSLRVQFLAAPILMPAGQTALPLPEEPGYEWTWVQWNGRHLPTMPSPTAAATHNGQPAKNPASTGWLTIPSRPIVPRRAFESAFAQGAQIWEALLKQGWVQPLPGTQAWALRRRKSERAAPTLALPPGVELADVERLLDTAVLQIQPTRAEARFNGRQEIREGWLQLSPAPEINHPRKDPKEKAE